MELYACKAASTFLGVITLGMEESLYKKVLFFIQKGQG